MLQGGTERKNISKDMRREKETPEDIMVRERFDLSSCNPMSVAQATCFRIKREKVVALHALDWQSVSYSKHEEHTNLSTHNLQAPRFIFSILIQKSGPPKKVVGLKIFIV